ETIDVLYVVDDQRRLIGVVTLRSLVLAAADALVGSIMIAELVWASTDEDREEVARRLLAHDLLAIPVVDRERRLVGIVTVDDAVAVLEREDTEDVVRMGGASPLGEPYITASVPRVFRARVGWLLVLFVAEAFTGTVLRAFEGVLEEVVALAFFVPLLIGTGGNAGSQTTTTIVRAMAIGEVRFGDAARVMWKELRVGLLLGLTMAAVGTVRAVTWGTGHQLAFVVASALVAVVLLATFVGSFLPMVLRRLRLDPAVVSAPFITTFVDAAGPLTYFLLGRGAGQSRRSGSSATIRQYSGWKLNCPAISDPTCSRVSRAWSWSMRTGLPAAIAASCAWQVRSAVMYHHAAASTDSPTVSSPW